MRACVCVCACCVCVRAVFVCVSRLRTGGSKGCNENRLRGYFLMSMVYGFRLCRVFFLQGCWTCLVSVEVEQKHEVGEGTGARSGHGRMMVMVVVVVMVVMGEGVVCGLWYDMMG